MKCLRIEYKPIFVVLFWLAIAVAGQAQITTLTAPDGTTVEINRDDYGVPHITGQSEIGVYFGQGFAVAGDRLYQLELYRRTAEGKLAEWFGVAFLPLDQQIRQQLYTEAERIQAFETLESELQEMFEAYTAGINTYLDSMTVNPARYMPLEFQSLSMETWTVYKSVAISQWQTAIFGQFGGEELIRLGELQTHG